MVKEIQLFDLGITIIEQEFWPLLTNQMVSVYLFLRHLTVGNRAEVTAINLVR
jgi:hypothetical protein